MEIINYLKYILLYNEGEPMIFTRLFFWGFFAIVLAVYSIIYKQRVLRNAFLFAVSLFFYYKSSGFFFSLLIFSTIADYLIGLGIHSSRTKILKTGLLVLSISINLFLLGYFKFAYLFTDTCNVLFHTDIEVFNHFAYWCNDLTGSTFRVDAILLPVGISFYTFQTISYSVDVYKEKIPPVRNILDFGFYVSFFPQLVAGPIVRASEFIPQLYQDYKLSKQEWGLAIFWIMKGMIKKILIADYIAVNFIDRVFENPILFTGFENLMALYAYSLQVYCDFAGYTDIAIGVALLMGFRLPVNFNAPYKAKSVGEFWKRWHISLSTWLKDYLYIPLGGSQKASVLTFLFLPLIAIIAMFIAGKAYFLWILGGSFLSLGILLILIRVSPKFGQELATTINLLITMLLGGLWHGASWLFVIWGGLNGIALVVYKQWKKISPWENSNHFLVIAWRIFLTFNFITFTRIWFRADSLEKTWLIMDQIGFSFNALIAPEIVLAYWKVFAIIALGFILHWFPDKGKDAIRDLFIETPVIVKIGAAVATIFIVYQSMSAGLNPFIYFQF